MRSRFLDEIPAELTERDEPTRPGADGSRPRATTWGDGGGGPPTDAPAAYRLGDDVVHAAFGEGVVTAVEPGGVVVIRFREGRGERKLVADLAPIRKG